MKKSLVSKSNITQSKIDFEGKSQIFDILKKNISAEQKVIVSISGGPDSMMTAVLAYNYFLQNRYDLNNLIFVHFNHKIRKASDQEEIFLKEYFRSVNLVCVCRTVKSKINEESLRDWRYSNLKKIASKYGVSNILLGHNLTDRIESSFMNLLRGASLQGFMSMSEVQAHHLISGVQIIRPILSLTKTNVEKICIKNKIPFVVDKSNLDASVSLRNKLRNQILPTLYKLGNKADSFVESMSKIYNEIEELNSARSQDIGLVESLKSVCWKSKFAYQRKVVAKNIGNTQIASVLKELNIYSNVSSKTLDELKNFLINSKDGFKYLNKTYFFVSHGHIYIIQAAKDFWKKSIKKSMNIVDQNVVFDDFVIRAENDTKGTVIRYPKIGDRYKNKTWNQYCIAAKIPVFWRNYIPVLIKGGKIVKVIKPLKF